MNEELRSFDRNGVQFAWDATSISSAQKCMRYYQLKHLEGWSPKGTGVHLRFGQHYATALEHFYKLRFEGKDFTEALHDVVREALEATWDRTEENPEGAPWQSGHETKTRENLIRTIVWYCDQFREDPAKVIALADGRPAVELSFSLPVDNDIVFCGHIDRLVNYADELMVSDQKTTASTISSYYFQQYSPNTQMSMYTFAGQMIYNVAVKGVIIDAAQIAVGFSRFQRGMTYRTKSQLEEWYKDTLVWIAAAQDATLAGQFPMNPASCNNYGGCEFRGICSKSPEVRKQFLLGDFVQAPRWDPLKSR